MTPLGDERFEVAQAEAAKAAVVRANRGLTDEVVAAANPAQPAGDPAFARDAYGSRFLLAAPFGYGPDEPDRWHAWDIDLCGLDVVVRAGVFGSAKETLEEWRDAVGTVASGAALTACPEQAWYARRHGTVPEDFGDTVATVINDWGRGSIQTPNPSESLGDRESGVPVRENTVLAPLGLDPDPLAEYTGRNERECRSA